MTHQHSANSLDVATRLLRHTVQKDKYPTFDAMLDMGSLSKVELAMTAAQMAEAVSLVLNDVMGGKGRDRVLDELITALRGSAKIMDTIAANVAEVAR